MDRWVNQGWAWASPFFKTMGSSVKNSVNVILWPCLSLSFSLCDFFISESSELRSWIPVSEAI